MQTYSIALALVLVVTPAVKAAPSDQQAKRIADAIRVVDESRTGPDKSIPADIWRRAECVAVVPGLKKAAFVLGGEYGEGLVSCRTGHSWSAPAFLKLEKASWGAQIGAESVDLVLLFMNRNGVERLLEDKVTLGADASLAAGPMGRTAGAATDARVTAEILSYSRAHGVFAGVDLSGGVVRPDEGADAALYGRNASAREILFGGAVRTPATARPFIAALMRAGTDTTASSK